mgnify:CR=1 FL=1
MFDPRVIRHGPWSLSKAGTLSSCAQQYHYRYVQKLQEARKSAQAQVGTAGHKILEVMLKPNVSTEDQDTEYDGLGLAAVAKKVAQEFQLTTAEVQTVEAQLPWIEDYLERIADFRRDARVVKEYAEIRLGMTAEYDIAAFFKDPHTFFRGVIDHAFLTEDDYLVIWDHKSGRKKSIQEHSAQLYSYMLLAHVNWPEVRGFQCGINYFGSNNIDWFPRHDGTSGIWTPTEVVQYVVPWLERYLNTLTKRLQVIDETQQGRPEPGWVCDWCGFVDRCEAGQRKVQERAEKRRVTPNV